VALRNLLHSSCGVDPVTGRVVKGAS
jgi:hypothetical protein